MEYLIYDNEIDKGEVVKAPGILEAMFEYLPWPTLNIEVEYKPWMGAAIVKDNTTGFLYNVTW